MRLTVTKEDFKQALCRRFLLTEKRWRELEEEARQIAAERELEKNKRRTDELLRVPVGDPGWLAAHNEITRLFKEHDRLMDIAFPRVPSPTPPPEAP